LAIKPVVFTHVFLMVCPPQNSQIIVTPSRVNSYNDERPRFTKSTTYVDEPPISGRSLNAISCSSGISSHPLLYPPLRMAFSMSERSNRSAQISSSVWEDK
jgi:hypothetical protein